MLFRLSDDATYGRFEWGAEAEAIVDAYYADRASVADASLLALAEEANGRVVVTTDREDFAVYRLHRRRAVPPA